MFRHLSYLLAFSAFTTAAALSAQDDDTNHSEAPENQIVVTGEREKEAQQRVNEMTKAITRRPKIDKPIARQYGDICVGVFGMSADYANGIIGQVEENARALGIRVSPEGCRVNTLIAFVRDGHAELEDLRKSAPWLFESLLDYEYKRILRGSGGAFAWHSTKVKEVDGKEMAMMSFGNPPRDVVVSDPFTASNISQQIRVDMIGSVVLIEKSLVPGKTIRQLADYISMRSFASVDDMASDGPDTTSTILSLFTSNGPAAEGMTDFDWSYLEALYKLPSTAQGSAVHDAAWSAYRKRALKIDDDRTSD
ncbi:hypothetical protein [Erythrobacter sp. SAORIC-644]|uniref:hypothetical protein n=1 Tax=Erythrobacter sp. SAORIC-644 TaxID=1869314 RepID=UPI001F2CFD87|nr:hypothetical protein [Erythrobacter sp. SAORIC-644]